MLKRVIPLVVVVAIGILAIGCSGSKDMSKEPLKPQGTPNPDMKAVPIAGGSGPGGDKAGK